VALPGGGLNRNTLPGRFLCFAPAICAVEQPCQHKQRLRILVRTQFQRFLQCSLCRDGVSQRDIGAGDLRVGLIKFGIILHRTLEHGDGSLVIGLVVQQQHPFFIFVVSFAGHAQFVR